MAWVNKKPEDYVFQGYSENHLSYRSAYRIFQRVEIGPSPVKGEEGKTVRLYPHFLRAQRASCLIAFYHWRLEEMMEWTSWEEVSTARMYAKFGKEALSQKLEGYTYPV